MATIVKPIFTNEGCGICLEIDSPECEDLIFSLGLAATSDFTWTLVDKFNSVFTGASTSDGSGSLPIALSSLPDGLLSPYSGSFLFRLYNSSGAQVSFTQDSKTYNCLSLTIYRKGS